MKKLFLWRTKVGTFYIVQVSNGMYQPLWNDEALGDYRTPQQAVDDLTGGHTVFPSTGVDPSTLGISNDLEDWEHL